MRSPIMAEQLNRHCFSLAVEPQALRDQLAQVMETVDPATELAVAHGHLFSALPAFVPQRNLERMVEAVKAITAAATRRHLDAAMAWAPAVARRNQGSPGGVLSFDVYLSGKP